MSQENNDKWGTIRIRKSTADMIKNKGKKGETYDDVLKRLLKKRR